VGISVVGGLEIATEWTSGNIISLGALPGANLSEPHGINDSGQTVGNSLFGFSYDATEWSASGARRRAEQRARAGGQEISALDKSTPQQAGMGARQCCSVTSPNCRALEPPLDPRCPSP
jgi:hypothetical protein